MAAQKFTNFDKLLKNQSLTPIQKNLYTPRFRAAQFTIAKCWKQLRCPSVNEWIKKHGHLHNGILCSVKKEGAPTLYDNIDGTEKHYAK